MIRRYSLRRRLLVSLLLVFVLGVGATVTFYYAEMGIIGRDLRQRTLRSQVNELLSDLRISDIGVRFDLPPSWAEAYSRKGSEFYYTLYDRSGRVVTTSPNRDRPLPYARPPDREPVGGLHFIGVGPERLAAVTARAPGGRTLIVARSHAQEESIIWTLLDEDFEYLGYILIPFAVAALALIWFISAWSLRPLVRASREAATVGPGNLGARITAAGLPGEIQPLVAAVNGALDRLAGAFAAQRQLTADAAHELRTPLAVLSLRLQRAKQEGRIDWPVLDREMAQMGRLVGQLLDLARRDGAERTDATDGINLNLSRIAREAAVQVLPIAEEKGRTIEVDAPDAVPLRGNPDDLRDMLRNLLENGIEHGAGTVTVTVRQEQDGAGTAVIDVSDEGAGVPGPLQEVVFNRFRKGRATSPGAGLGLAIVRQVARAHGGEVRFLPGARSRIRVTLPTARS